MILTAAIVLVGSELIRGSIIDKNGQFISNELRSLGINITSVHIIRDEVEVITNLVRFLSSSVTYVITVGGLGPTLDDVTLEAVARAFGLPLVTREPEDIAAYARMSGSETTQTQLRYFPDGSEIIPTDHGPVVRTGNVYSLPGLPRLVKARFPTLLRRLNSGVIHTRTLLLSTPQSHIASLLERIGEQHPSISIGCYPSSNLREGTTLLFEGTDMDEINRCVSFLESSLNIK